MNEQKEMILLKDVVIPAGTRLTRAARMTKLYSPHYEALVGFGNDNTGSFIISPDDLPNGIMTELI